jgi:hypothetical protein
MRLGRRGDKNWTGPAGRVRISDWHAAAWVSRRSAVGWLEGDERGLGVGPLLGESVEVMGVLLDRGFDRRQLPFR